MDAPGGSLTALLEHHGVKGMHWGVRRTASELRRRGVTPEAVSSAARKLSKDPTKAAIRARAKEVGGLHKVADDELKVMLDRMNMEKRYRDMMSEDAKRRQEGLKTVGKILGEFGKVILPVVATAAAGAAARNYATTGSVFRSARTGARVIEGTARALGS